MSYKKGDLIYLPQNFKLRNFSSNLKKKQKNLSMLTLDKPSWGLILSMKDSFWQVMCRGQFWLVRHDNFGRILQDG